MTEAIKIGLLNKIEAAKKRPYPDNLEDLAFILPEIYFNRGFRMLTDEEEGEVLIARRNAVEFAQTKHK